MVLADALCAMNVAASAMINGVCCCYQMNHDLKRQKEHERTIRTVDRSNLPQKKDYELMTRKGGDLIKKYNDHEHRHRHWGQPFANGYDSRDYEPVTERTYRPTEMLSSHSFSRMATQKSRNRSRRTEGFHELYSGPSLFDEIIAEKSTQKRSSLGDPIYPRLSLLDEYDDGDEDSLSADDSLSDNDNDTDFEEICLE